MTLNKESSFENYSQVLNVFPKKKNTTFLTISGRKRKQPSPQKVFHKETSMQGYKCRSKTDKQDLLQEQAPELGSLKGDYNWNSVFDDFFGPSNTEVARATGLAVTKSSTATVPSDIITNLMGNNGPGPIQPLGTLILQGDNVEELNNENKFSTTGQNNNFDETDAWNRSDNEKEIFAYCNPDYSALSLDQINDEKDMDNLIDVGDIDLTITGRQIEPPAEWVPVSGDIDAILCEKQDHNLLKPDPTQHLHPLFVHSIGSLPSDRKTSCKPQHLQQPCSTSNDFGKKYSKFSTAEFFEEILFKPSHNKNV